MKYLYVLVGSKNGFYCEQTLVSMASLKNVQPNAFVTLLIDSQTDKDFEPEINRIRKYVNEYIVVPIEECVPPIAKSRYIKTSMRKYVKGDFLYIDADTVWNAPICETDFTHDVMGVLDGHCLLSKHLKKFEIEEEFRKTNCHPGVERYVNGGVLFSKDSERSKIFFDMWHERWLETSKSGYFIDMPALNYAIKQVGNVFALLPDVYNVQISRSWKFFMNAKIIHFFTGWLAEPFEQPYLFQKKSFWNVVKENGVDDFVQNAINNPLTVFDENFGLFGNDENKFRQTALYGFVADSYVNRNNKKTFFVLEKCIQLLSKVFR